MKRYIKAGDSILDVSGGPGKYSIYFAKKGCDVTLVDLSSENVRFAKQKAIEEDVEINAYQGDACYVNQIVNGKYDHVFLMGALYHLQDENQRIMAVSACLDLLKNNGVFYASFISNVAEISYYFKNQIYDSIFDNRYLDCYLNDVNYTGLSFTHAYYVSVKNVLPFFEQYDLEKLHYFGQESILAHVESNLAKQLPEVIDNMIDLAIKVCEREDLLSHAEHLMYIGRKLKCNK